MKWLLNPLILLDCCLNWLIGGDINETLSACAHRMRTRHQPYFFWLADAIDLLFFWQTEHCKSAWQYEQEHGGALSWLPSWLKGAR